jgi:hypothetical protein
MNQNVRRKAVRSRKRIISYVVMFGAVAMDGISGERRDEPVGVVRVLTSSGSGISRAAARGEEIVRTNQSLRNHAHR